jgi:hypothetical protein
LAGKREGAHSAPRLRRSTAPIANGTAALSAHEKDSELDKRTGEAPHIEQAQHNWQTSATATSAAPSAPLRTHRPLLLLDMLTGGARLVSIEGLA